MPEGYVKFLAFGGRAPTLPEDLVIFNKVGDAYGFLTDVAYFVERSTQTEFLPSGNGLCERQWHL